MRPKKFTIRNRRGRARWKGGGKCRSDFPVVAEEVDALLSLLHSGDTVETLRSLIVVPERVREAVEAVEQTEGFLMALPLRKALEYRQEVLAAFNTAVDRLARGQTVQTERDGERRTKVPKTCLLCLSPWRKEIEAALAGGEPYRSIAQRLPVSLGSLSRHWSHVCPALLKRA